MKSKPFLYLAFLMLIVSCETKSKEIHTISLYEVSLGKGIKEREQKICIRSYCKIDLITDSVEFQIKNNDSVPFSSSSGYIFGISKKSTIVDGLISINKYHNGWIKKTTSVHHDVIPFYCFVENIGSSGSYLYFTKYRLDKNISDMIKYMINDAGSSTYMVHHNRNLIDERIIETIVKNAVLLAPPPLPDSIPPSGSNIENIE